MYSMYYFGFKGPNPLIYGRKEKYASDTTQAKPMPPVEQLK